MEGKGAIDHFESSLLERIRQRPPLFLGERSLSALRQFFSGYYFAYHELGTRAPELIPNDFHDWVAYRLQFRESTLGYAKMILERTPDEERALKMFFELLDEHGARQAKVVAKISQHPPDRRIRRMSQGPNGELVDGDEATQAEQISIVIYTEAPGFFVVSGDPLVTHLREGAFCPTFSWLHKSFRPDPEFTTVLDQAQFDRLLKEEAESERKTREESEIRQRNAAKQEGKID
jgi:hypothetical protein